MSTDAKQQKQKNKKVHKLKANNQKIQIFILSLLLTLLFLTIIGISLINDQKVVTFFSIIALTASIFWTIHALEDEKK